tara:strand:- start:1710 stop:1919 length:210 start_codon:yes stop_codon:yes gene_type:complete
MQNLYITISTDNNFVTTKNKRQTDDSDFNNVVIFLNSYGKNTTYNNGTIYSLEEAGVYVSLKNDTLNNI